MIILYYSSTTYVYIYTYIYIYIHTYIYIYMCVRVNIHIYIWDVIDTSWSLSRSEAVESQYFMWWTMDNDIFSGSNKFNPQLTSHLVNSMVYGEQNELVSRVLTREQNRRYQTKCFFNVDGTFIFFSRHTELSINGNMSD